MSCRITVRSLTGRTPLRLGRQHGPCVKHLSAESFEALIDQLSEELCLDRSRVYATGFSNGGSGSAALACLLSDHIAAIGVIARLADFGARCEGSRAVPVLAFHGTADPLALFEGGIGPLVASAATDIGVDQGDLPMASDPVWSAAIADQTAAIAERYDYSPEPVVEMVTDDVERIVYACPPGLDVQLVVVGGAGHVWPRLPLDPALEDWLGPANLDIDATQMIWESFEQHRVPE